MAANKKCAANYTLLTRNNGMLTASNKMVTADHKQSEPGDKLLAASTGLIALIYKITHPASAIAF